jgi:hypothetical protein
LPSSTLKGMVDLLKNDQQISKLLTCPVDDFFNENRKTPGGGGGGPDQARRTKEKEGDLTMPPKPTTNPTIPPLCLLTVNKLKNAHPGWTIPKFAVECGMTTHQFVVGTKGRCSNYQLLGKCKAKSCSYKHIPCTVTDAKQKEVAAQILEGLKVIKLKKASDKS